MNTAAKKLAGFALAAAAASLFMSAPVFAGGHPADTAKVHCQGVNACKGQSDCKSATHACKGQNSCKGQGFKLMTKSECQKAGGKVEGGM